MLLEECKLVTFVGVDNLALPNNIVNKCICFIQAIALQGMY